MPRPTFIQALAALAVALGFTYLFLVTFFPMTEGGKEYADYILASITGTIGLVLGYYFGNSDNNNNPPTNPTL